MFSKVLFVRIQALHFNIKTMIRNKNFNSFSGNFIYDKAVPKNHYLRKINELVNWTPIAQKLSACYKGKFQLGASAINPVTMFKMLLLGYIYNVSDRKIEILCNDSITYKYFIEIAIDEKAPDHASLSVFRKRIINHYGDSSVFEEMFTYILQQISKHQDIEFGEIQLIDSKHQTARVSKYRKTKHNKKDSDNDKKKKLKSDIDPDATLGVKTSLKYTDAEGNSINNFKTFFGYKSHCSIESKNNLITSCILSTGKDADGNYFEPLLWKDLSRRGMASIYGADKGYDWGDIHMLLQELEIGDAILLKETRLKDDKRCAIWHKLSNTQAYKKGKKTDIKLKELLEN